MATALPTPAARKRAAIERETATKPGALTLGTIAEERESVRRAARASGRTLPSSEVRRLAFTVMAAWIERDFPYLSAAVDAVLADVEHTPADRHAVDALARLLNVTTRGLDLTASDEDD